MIRWALVGTLLSVMVLGAMGARMLVRVGIHEGYSHVQPIAFSHKLHAGDNQVPCLYCHFAATQGRHAGIPPGNVCMNCHGLLEKQTGEIEKVREAFYQQRSVHWVKVHNLPDFVYFNHSQHVRVGGVKCQECHGAVETMVRVKQDAPLNMGWCLDCHKKRGVGETETKTDCIRCHY